MKKYKNVLLLVVTSALLTLVVSCGESKPYKKIIGSTMGTSYSIILKSRSHDLAELHQIIDDELADINQLMSTYIADSEINRFNRLTDNSCFKFSDKSWQVLLAAKQVYRETDGAFDITLGPLISRWGFSAEEFAEKVPAEKEVIALLQQVGTDKLLFDDDNQCISKAHPNISINLSAIAKGFAVDQLATLLEQNDINNYLVEIGGEVKASGLNSTGKNWRIAVEQPAVSANQRQQSIVVRLVDTSIATSGDYRNYFEVDGQRFSHTIDPATGYPIKHQLISVSVLHPSNMYADAYATAFNVLGGAKALTLAKQLRLGVYTISHSDHGIQTKTNQLFQEAVSP